MKDTFNIIDQMGSVKRVAVIGAGPAGLIALKTAKQYGHHVTCFELQSSFGGQWCVTQDMMEQLFEALDGQKYGIKSVYKSLMFNTSIYDSAFSDFPAKVDINNAFWTPDSYMAYLASYVEYFHMGEHIKFNAAVEKLEKTEAKWRVKFVLVTDPHKDSQYAEFDNVIIASGPFRHPVVPPYKNKEQFQGIAVHSGQVRDDEQLFKEKRVVVVGYGNSGLEMTCCALKAGAQKVYMSMSYDAERRQHWVGNRYHLCPDINNKKPYDCFRTRHNYFDHPEIWIDFLKSWSVPEKCIPKEFTPGEDGVNVTEVNILTQKEKDGVLEKVVDIDHFSNNGMQLVDGTDLENIDVVVFATGFQTRYPFLDGVWGRQEQKLCELYKYVVPTEEALDGVCFISTANILGALFPVMDMQARYICEKVLSRQYDQNGFLFNEAERQSLLEEVQRQRDYNKGLRRPYNFHTDNAGYILNLAKEMGCDPVEPKQMFQEARCKKDVELGVAVKYGPLIGAQYRLRGAHTWDGAADFLISVAREMLGESFDKLVEKHMKND